MPSHIIMPIALFALMTACSNEIGPPLVVSDVEVTRPIPGASMSAGYMALTNNSDEIIRISSIRSPQYGSIEIHETTIEGDVARMRAVEELIIGPGDTIRLERGGKHLMMMQPIDNIETVTLNLHAGDLLLLSVRTSPSSSGS